MANHGFQPLAGAANMKQFNIAEVTEKHAPIKYGTLKGKIWISDNFDDPLPDDVLDEFEKGGGPLLMKPGE
jgi:hypothetical protein